jgi:IS6 family transposase
VYRCAPCRHSFTLTSRTDFSGYHTPPEAIALALHHYFIDESNRKLGVSTKRASYSEVVKWLSERGIRVDRSTVFDWVKRFRSSREQQARFYQFWSSESWLRGNWHIREKQYSTSGSLLYLYLAVDELRRIMDFYCSEYPAETAADAFFRKQADKIKNRGEAPPQLGQGERRLYGRLLKR